MKPTYRYFVQPQVNTATKTIVGYELLMKQLTPAGWRLPDDFAAIDSQTIADLLIATTKVLSLKVLYCSINVSREQLMTTSIAQAIIKSQQQLYPTKLVVELTEEDGPENYPLSALMPVLQSFIDQGLQLSLDDVGTGDNYFSDVQTLLPLVSEMKFALQNYKLSFHDPKMQQRVHFWRAMSVEYGLRLVLEGVEDAADNALSQKLGIKYKQGYYFSKPQLLKLPGDLKFA
ncbi:EAL domain-containing protein [Lactiplantibacillus daowaiensis]|uniref:EAL domain-containing protein n=1 Tax=Lactiplantibacillus daowaiensis TaxID=2559918 RepID=A0ABW1RYR2_9LACO|nr:EAL domain-containing protein [Lactiplantibacillus daowaiensis]